ncbi:MAG: ABC transporter ATP-binding protein [Actinobacteria bacterium]|jgi:thiamine transport system ATP-binding protein|nr:ABC transporter ATP-binding protein [Actinomycetota bacterium]MBT3686753.1 ABC transporter ATP-binding protein [Actinomycetota bacterium]MBT4036556.1 ABC transporter ATP-binding protein [Actinomycetota bacterium]MBT4278141.1 ABC transporter ATP-binding protein [Actinomycetota bacterium]MBT4343416.1 ABC transporter ATP-binding protein [Actinomycetota bacterium]
MLRVEGLRVVLGEVVVLDGLDLEVAEGEIVVLLGPSGCGKSTLLRTIVGLERPSGGRVVWSGEDLTSTAPHQRDFGLVFQDHALFPHMNVASNVAFGLRVAGLAVAGREARVAEVLDLVGLEGFGGRSVDTLSGGEAQRVALARSLAPGPRLLMLDEPLGSLDRVLRDRLVEDLGVLLGGIGQASIYVTHDHDEAFALADRIAIMGEGRIRRIGTVAEVWSDPVSSYVARCLGHENLVELDRSGGCALGRLGDGPGTVLLRPGQVVLSQGPDGIEATVVGSLFRSDRFSLRVAVGDMEVLIPAAEAVPNGSGVRLSVGPDAVIPLTV